MIRPATTLDGLNRAAKELHKAEREGVDVGAMLDELVALAKGTAEAALEAALASGLTNPKALKEIGKAENELAKAEHEIAKGHQDHASHAYAKVLKHAENAMRDKRDDDSDDDSGDDVL